jgi:hypothetical protein
MNVTIELVYHCCPCNEVEIPGIESWSDIKQWYVKWDTFYYTLDGEKWLEVEMDSDLMECIDTKRPASATVYDANYANELDAH